MGRSHPPLQLIASEANGARWPSRSSKSVAPRNRGEAGFDSQALPPTFSNSANLVVGVVGEAGLRTRINPQSAIETSLQSAERRPPGALLGILPAELPPA